MITQRPLIIAHRGAPTYAPENTMSSVKKAVEFGADMVEVDVQLTKDHVPVIIHDSKVNRTTNGVGKVSSFLFSELQKLDAGSWFSGDFNNEKIPTLEELLVFAKGKCRLLLELKKSKEPRLFGEKVIDLIQKHEMANECIIHSFQSEILKQVSSIHADIVVQKLAVGNILFFPVHFDYSLQLGKLHDYDFVSGVNPSGRFISRKTIESLHDKGLTVYIWTENDADKMKKLISWGVDGIISDRPDLLKKVLSGYQ